MLLFRIALHEQRTRHLTLCADSHRARNDLQFPYNVCVLDLGVFVGGVLRGLVGCTRFEVRI